MPKKTQRERIIEYLVREYGMAPEYLWRDYPDACVFRNPINKKWFVLIMNVMRVRAGVPGDGAIDLLTIKCSPDMMATILSRDMFLPAYHMNKNTWASVPMDDRLSDAQIYPLLSASWDNAAPRVRAKKK